jgi:orotidine-5'-phosphate decarboxylase
MSIDARTRLIVAPNTTAEVDVLLSPALRDGYEILKIGWALYLAAGRPLVERVRGEGKQVFLDLKFGDIPNTVKNLMAEVVALDVRMTTINAEPQTIRAAVDAKGDADVQVLTVTLLTSMDAADLRDASVGLGVDDYVLYRARRAREAGSEGVIASGREAAAIRAAHGDALVIVTPGIRLADAGADDHKRAVTPAAAIAAGADYLVVGRPIVESRDPTGATRRILDEMQAAFDARR